MSAATPAAGWLARIGCFARKHITTLLALLAVVLAAHFWQTRHLPTGTLPDVTLQLLNGERLHLSEWRARYPGQPVALHIWAEWCPICRTEESSVTRIQTDWPVLTVAMQSGQAHQVQRVLRQRGLPWTTAIDTDGALARSLGVHAVPALLVLDANGQLRAASIGYTSEMGMRLRLLWAAWHNGRLPLFD